MECSLNVETHHIYSSIHTHQRLRLHAIEKRSGNRIVVSDIEPLSNVNHTLTINTNTHNSHDTPSQTLPHHPHNTFATTPSCSSALDSN